MVVIMQNNTMSYFGKLRSRRLGVLPFLLLLAVICLYSTGCVKPTATPYQAIAKGEGYQEDKVGQDQYLVEFRGNKLTTPAVTKNYMLYRCAELTVEKECSYFIVLGMSEAPYTPVMAAESLPGHLAQVKVFKDRPPSSEGEGYDAKELMAKLEPQMIRKR